MSQEKTISKSVKIAIIIAVVIFASTVMVLAIPQLEMITGYSHDSKDTSDANHISVPSASNGGVHVIGEMRTINNTHCVNTLGGPQIC